MGKKDRASTGTDSQGRVGEAMKNGMRDGK
jgi:hypothetical protein